MVQQQFPRGGAQASMLLPFFASQAAQQLIQRQALIAEAEHLGLRATDEDVRDELQHGRYAQIFFPAGNFIGQAPMRNCCNSTISPFPCSKVT